MKKLKLKKEVKKVLIILVLTLIVSIISGKTYARYVSSSSSDSEIRVAQFGNLSLVEKLNGNIQSNSGDAVTINETEITIESEINKEVYVEFSDSEISSYVFLKIDTKNWYYNEEKRVLGIQKNNSNLLYFELGSDWNYMKESSSNGSYIFYSLYDVEKYNYKKYSVLEKIEVGIIGYDDFDYVNDSEIKFNAYSIQKSDNLEVLDAWNYLNI